MNLQTFTREIRFISIVLGTLLALSSLASAEWTVDFSRRSEQMGKKEYVAPDASHRVEAPGVIESLFQQVVPTEEIVILNTENGFLPSTIRLREGVQYRFVIVNINDKAKNVSFVLDAFAEHHATFYGQMKSFYVNPKKSGIFTFVSPETSAKGRVVVQGITPRTDEMPELEIRTPASQGQ